MRARWLFFFLSPYLLFSTPSGGIELNLRNPSLQEGVLSTNEGGVITGEDLRIQAEEIRYSGQKIEASGNLLIQYKGRAYVGKKLEYDVPSKTGTIEEGKTFSSMWYVVADKIFMQSDGSYKADGVSITTCENSDSSWDIHAKKIEGKKKDLIHAKKVRFRLFKMPTLWLPSFHVNLKKFREPILRYSVNWDKGSGPRASVRYQLYSWEDFALYGRVDWRMKRGFGGAIETEYVPSHERTSFVTRSYLATDTLENAPTDFERRYRVEGLFKHASSSLQTHTTLSWDKYSDVRMPQDFRSDDFELGPPKRTLFYLHHQEKNLTTYLKVRPRVNPFESIKQDLPTLFLSLRPTEIGQSGIFFDHFSKASYIDFAYSNELTESLGGFRSIRLELRDAIYRPVRMGPLIATPLAGFLGIFYSDSPESTSKAVASFAYGGRLYAEGVRRFDRHKHIVQPYAEYMGLTRPTTPPDQHYIFTIADGYDRLNQIRGGVRQLLFHPSEIEPIFTSDLYANAFMTDRTIPQWIPKTYLLFTWKAERFHFTSHTCWNFENKTLDFCNNRALVTVTDDLAFTLEARYRSRFDFRKADHENFILDVTRSEEDLLSSPLSDKRLALLTHLFYRPSPFWEIHFRSHHAFLRPEEPPYNEFKFDLFTYIASAWKVRLTYTHTEKDDRVTAGINLIKK
jgi:hypothetical protein